MMKLLCFIINNNVSFLNKTFSCFNKKMLCIFLSFIMLFSVVIPANQEIKTNFISALNCAFSAVEYNFFDSYSSMVMPLIGNIFASCSTLLASQQKYCKDKKNENKKSSSENASETDGIFIVESNLANQTSFNTLKQKINNLTYSETNKLYILYSSIMEYESKTSATNMWMLFFILFSIFTVRIKDVVKNNIIIKNICNIKPAWLR